jgi:hypothetical protein
MVGAVGSISWPACDAAEAQLTDAPIPPTLAWRGFEPEVRRRITSCPPHVLIPVEALAVLSNPVSSPMAAVTNGGWLVVTDSSVPGDLGVPVRLKTGSC